VAGAGLRAFDVAYAPPFQGGVDWRAVDPADYGDVVFVCGPFGNGEPVVPFLEKFAGRPLYGVNLTMLQSLAGWNPFARLWSATAIVRCGQTSHLPRATAVGCSLWASS
jgi:hypothetical protein